MALTAMTSPCPGIWPLGEITVTTSGTPVALNINVGAQTNGTPTTRPSGNVRSLILSAFTANTGDMLLIRKAAGQSNTKANTGFIAAVIAPGHSISLPGSAGLASDINIDDWLIDATASSNSVVASALVG